MRLPSGVPQQLKKKLTPMHQMKSQVSVHKLKSTLVKKVRNTEASNRTPTKENLALTGVSHNIPVMLVGRELKPTTAVTLGAMSSPSSALPRLVMGSVSL
jgi:hypothetical protein